MSRRLRIIDRDSPMLLPPSIQEWIGEDHPAKLIVEMINHVDLSGAVINERGSGDQQYPPGMMLALLIFCYSGGVFSSRKIETATYDNVGVRFICANHHPDHDTICKFRKENAQLLRSVFAQTLRLAADLQLVDLNGLEIASDGTVITVSASEKQYRSRAEIELEIDQITRAHEKLEQQVDDLLNQAEEIDRKEANSATLPGNLCDPGERSRRITEALECQKRLERRKAKLQAACEFQKLATQEAAERRDEFIEEVRSAGIGHVPKGLSREVDEEKKVNIHEPEAPKMKLKKGGYGHGYNAQASVDIGGIGLALGGHLTAAANDRQQLEPCVDAVELNLGSGCVAVSLADRGYDNTYQIDRLERRGVNTLCELQQSKAEAGGKAPATKRGRALRTYERRQRHLTKIKSADNREKRKRRKETVEPLFGTIKTSMGFRQFMVRGLNGADGEWHLVLLCSNIQKLGRNQTWREYLAKMKRKGR